MNLQPYLRVVDELISKTDDILSKSARVWDRDSKDKFRDVNVQMRQLVRTLYPDADMRISDFDSSIKVAIGRDKPWSFTEQAKVTRRYLVSIKDSINMRMDVEEKEVKLGTLRKEVEEKEMEAERREKVTETKFYGAAIEIIDRLREQLKDKGAMEQEIIKMRSELAEIKELLKGITKESIPKEKESTD